MRRAWNLRAREDSRRFIACGHSATDDAFWASGTRELELLVLRDLELKAGARALEIGCGIGRLLRPLAPRVEKAFGVDISDEMVRQAEAVLRETPNVEVRRTDGTLASFGDATLDLVYSFIVFQHVPAKRSVSTYVREAARILKGNGVFRFQVDGRPRRRLSSADTWRGVWYAPDELRRVLVSNAFEVLDLWGEGTHYFWVTALRMPQAGRPSSESVGVKLRDWDREELARLLSRLGDSAPETADRVIRGDLSLRRVAASFLDRRHDDPAEEFVRAAFRAILGREPDVGALEFYSKEIAGGIPPENTVDSMLASAELEDRVRPVVGSRA